MAIQNDWNINYLTKQINHLQWKDEITSVDSSVAQIQTITPVAVSGNIASGNYFKIYSATNATSYYVWYNVASGGGDPAPVGFTAIPVPIGASDTAQQVSTATVTAINSVAGTDFTAANSSGAIVPITLTNDNKGSATAAATTTGLTGFTYAIGTPGIGNTVWSTNSLYSYLQDTFDELGQMDDMVPMSAQTPTEYSLINQWFIDEVSIKYLRGGAIKTIGWTRVEAPSASANNGVVQVGYSSSTTEPDTNDIGTTVTSSHANGDTGTLLFADVTRNILWIRPDTTAATDSFNNTSGTLTCVSGMSISQSVVSATGENTWANMYTIGTIESNTAIYIVQDGAKLSAWWPVGHIDVLIRVREMGSEVGANSGALTQLLIGAREYSKLFDHFVSTGITGGRNPVPLATAADLNNTTGQYQTIVTTASAAIDISSTVTFTADATSDKQGTITSVSGTFPNLTIRYYLSGTALTPFVNTDACTTSTGVTFTVVTPTFVVTGYTNITVNFAYITRNLNNGSGSRYYDVEIDLINVRSVAQMYEWLKLLTMRGHSAEFEQLKTGTGTYSSPGFANIPGEQYISALSSFTPVKASPFGTFAGGKFFGAQGVWLANVPAAYAQNYQLIDSLGVTQVPPNTVSVTVSSVITNDVVGVFPLTDTVANGGIVDKETYTATAALNDTTIVTGTGIDARTPGSGVLRVIDATDSLETETQYEYISWTGSTFTLNNSTARSLTLTCSTGGSATVLIDDEATFKTWRVRVGDIITNTSDSAVNRVVSVDSETQLTTSAVSGTNTYSAGNSYTFETQVRIIIESPDTLYVPIINEIVWRNDYGPATTTEVSNTLIYTAPVIPVLVRVRQGKAILPFEIENTIGATGMSQAAIRTTDTIAT